jgi:acyl carrier protein
MSEPAPPALTAPEIAAWLQQRIAELLEVDISTVAVDSPFETYGLGSSDAVFLTGDLSELAGMPLSATLAWDFPTIGELAAFLAAVVRGEATLPSDQIDWDLDADLYDIS